MKSCKVILWVRVKAVFEIWRGIWHCNVRFLHLHATTKGTHSWPTSGHISCWKWKLLTHAATIHQRRYLSEIPKIQKLRSDTPKPRQSSWNQGTHVQIFIQNVRKLVVGWYALACSDMFREILPLGMTVHYCRSSYRRETCILFFRCCSFYVMGWARKHL